jgi:Ser/Thr protein kinase RdoA (MazF antagonist)
MLRRLARPRAQPEAGVASVLEEYGLRLVAPPAPPAGGGRSATVVVDTDRGGYVVKRYKPTVTEDTIRLEHSVLRHLAAVGFGGAPRLLLTPSGATAVERDGRRFAVFERIDGGYHYQHYLLLSWQEDRYIAAAAHLLADAHVLLAGFVPEGRNPNGVDGSGRRLRDLQWYEDRLRDCVVRTEPARDGKAAGELLARATRIEETLAATDAAMARAHPALGTLHGDFAPHNVLFRRRRPPVILDFENARRDHIILEVAEAARRFCGRSGKRRLRRTVMFLRRYREHAPHIESELELIPTAWAYVHARRFVVNWLDGLGDGTVGLERAVHQATMLEWMDRNRDAVTDAVATATPARRAGRT